jgi:hypothetical protein
MGQLTLHDLAEHFTEQLRDVRNDISIIKADITEINSALSAIARMLKNGEHQKHSYFKPLQFAYKIKAF